MMLKNTCLVMTVCLGLIAFPSQLPAIETSLVVTSKSLSLSIEADSDQNLSLGFDALMQQAETLANQTIQTEFSNSAQLENLALTVSLSRRGLVAPILNLSVARSQWQSQPNLQAWSRQIARSAELLGYITVPAMAKRSPVSNPSQPAVYSSGFFKINRPANSINRATNQPISQPIPGAFPSNYSRNSDRNYYDNSTANPPQANPQVNSQRSVAPSNTSGKSNNAIPASNINKRDD
jgi:hypothetical protein